MKALLLKIRDRIEQVWLRRWYMAPRMKLTHLEVRVDLSTPSGQARATASLRFRPQVASRRMTCLIGNAKVHSATAGGQPVAARCNPPFLVLKFPRKLPDVVEASVSVKYSYRPDGYGSLLQPTTREDCPERVFITCRRPLLGLVQGRLVKGTEAPPLRTYEWEPPRSRKLNVVVADVQSFRKATADGMSVWLHLHAEQAARAPSLLDLIIQLHAEAAESHHRKLPFADYHVAESDRRDVGPFNSPGLIVVPRGTFAISDRPTLYGILAAELNKEWRRDPTPMLAVPGE